MKTLATPYAIAAVVVGTVLGISVASADSTHPGAPSPGTTVTPTTTVVPAAPAAPPQGAAKRRTFTVAAIGDSLTDAKSNGGGYLTYLRKKCPKSRFDNHGKGGQMVNQMRARFAADVLGEGVSDKPSYSHVIVFGGVNDLYSDQTAGRTPEKIESDLLRMYKAARAKGMKVVALTVTPWGGFTKYWNASRKKATADVNRWISGQVAAKNLDHVIDSFALLSCGDADKLCPRLAEPYKDGLHFGPAGHEVLGKALHEKIFSDCE